MFCDFCRISYILPPSSCFQGGVAVNGVLIGGADQTALELYLLYF